MNAPSKGRCTLVGAGPGDPELLTLKAAKAIASATLILVDDLVNDAVLEHASPHARIVHVGKRGGCKSTPQAFIDKMMSTAVQAGEQVVRLKGGDPFVFARGYEEVLACAAAGIPVTVVPGVTSAIAVPAMAGVPVTHRAVNHEFVVVSGHLSPEHPESLVNWNALAQLTGTLVLMMAVERIELFAEILRKGGRPAETPVLVVQQGTTAGERVLRATLADVAEEIRDQGIRPPAIIVIGPVAGLETLKSS